MKALGIIDLPYGDLGEASTKRSRGEPASATGRPDPGPTGNGSGPPSSELVESPTKRTSKKARASRGSGQIDVTCTTGARHRTFQERPILSRYWWQFQETCTDVHAICFGPPLGSFQKPLERCSEDLAARLAPQNATDIGKIVPWTSQPTVPGELGRNFLARTQWNFGWMLGAYLACKMPWRTVR